MENISIRQQLNQNKMKTITLILCLFTLSIYGQTELSISQDAKLALFGDDKGNEAFTTDLTFRASQYINGTKDFYVFGFGEYESADLNGGKYERISIGFGLSFFTIIDNFDFRVLYSVGRIYRPDQDFNPSWDLSGQIGYDINNRFTVFAELQQTKRTDLKTQPFIYSGKIGIRINILN